MNTESSSLMDNAWLVGGMYLGGELFARRTGRSAVLDRTNPRHIKVSRVGDTVYPQPGRWNIEGAYTNIRYRKKYGLRGFRRAEQALRRQYGGEASRFLRNVSIDDMYSPRNVRRIEKLAKWGWGRAHVRELALDRALRRGSPRLANQLMLHRSLKSFVGGLNWYFATDMVGGLINMASQAAMNWRPAPYNNKRRQLETGGNFMDTRESYTQRQRAIMAIHNSQMTTMAVLGNEASMLHG